VLVDGNNCEQLPFSPRPYPSFASVLNFANDSFRNAASRSKRASADSLGRKHIDVSSRSRSIDNPIPIAICPSHFPFTLIV
jgi:hypothetical protein